jgi:tetraacyldisaccharide 4'-kinase
LEQFFLSLVRGERRGAGPWLLRLGLWAASVPYGWASRGRNWLFDRGWKKSHAANVPVVSVGNLTLGGTGKTPCVEYIARFCRSLDLRVAVLSRGYGAARGRNDEALVLEQNLPDVPHLQGGDRVALAQIAVEELESQLLILDDGFQHRRLQRDLDIVLLDATAPWGYGHLFPRGLLRESPGGLRRAGLVILTRCDMAAPGVLDGLRRRLERLAPSVPVVESIHRPAAWVSAQQTTVSLEALPERTCAAFCGIGNPEGFRRTLSNLGMTLAAWRVFPDHHAYTRTDVESLRAWARELPADAVVVTTQKDLVKICLDRLGSRPLWALRIDLDVVRGRTVLEEKLHQLVTDQGGADDLSSDDRGGLSLS